MANQTKQDAPMKGAMFIELPGRDPLTQCRNEDDKRVVLERDHVEMMRRPWLWPLENVLPLKRRSNSGENEMGILRATWVEHGIFIIQLGSIIEKHGEHLRYDSPEAAVALGWEVD